MARLNHGKRPNIHIAGGRLPEIIDAAEDSLLPQGHVYQRGEQLARTLALDRDTDEAGIRRQTGARVIAAVCEPWLTEQLARAAHWTVAGEQGKNTIDPPPEVCAHAP